MQFWPDCFNFWKLMNKSETVTRVGQQGYPGCLQPCGLQAVQAFGVSLGFRK